LVELQAEDDWSFIIKGHAFLEAIFSHILTSNLGNESLDDVLINLDMSNTRTGKVAFASALGLISTEERRFLRWFSELRNRIVHDVRHTRFDLDNYISSLDTNQRRSFIGAISFSKKSSKSDIAAGDFDLEKYALQSPKDAIWAAIMIISANLYFGPSFPMVFVLLVLLQAWVDKMSGNESSS
jgi:hypothetical protein